MPFADATQAASKSHDENANRPYKLVSELRNIQAVCNQAIHSPKVKPSEIASLTRAYVEAGKLILVHQGKPANTSQSIREPRETKRGRRNQSSNVSLSGPVEPSEAVQVNPPAKVEPVKPVE